MTVPGTIYLLGGYYLTQLLVRTFRGTVLVHTVVVLLSNAKKFVYHADHGSRPNKIQLISFIFAFHTHSIFNTMEEESREQSIAKDASNEGPFHTIVVTSPDSRAASAAQDGEGGPLHQQNLPSAIQSAGGGIQIISTSDPHNTRMGSGGGTLTALDEADESMAVDVDEDLDADVEVNDSANKRGRSVLIIHAGGQSSRCPTQMTLGKAWTDLPISQEESSEITTERKAVTATAEAKSTSTLTNPTYILMESLSNLLKELPSGSVVVAASDVMLKLPHDAPLSFDGVGDDKVLGLAVPAPLYTAKNHGVFSLDNSDDKNMGVDDGITRTSIHAVDTFFQKPSIETMQKFKGCTFKMGSSSSSNSSHDDKSSNAQEMAWIDTGVIIFLPKAANALRELIKGDLSHYSARGLKALYENTSTCTGPSNATEEPSQSLEDFAKNVVNSKLELYSHLLLAISTQGSMEKADSEKRLQSYLTNESNADFCPKMLEKIYAQLSTFELQVCTVPNGAFIHLGTTIELLEFLVSGSSENQSDNVASISAETSGINSLDLGLKLANRTNATLKGVEAGNQCVVINSAIDSTSSPMGASFVGPQTILEHCFLERTTLQVGSKSVVSGLRGKCDSSIDIPSNMVLQMLSLKDDSSALGFNSDESHYVFMYLGIFDEIKKHETCYGIVFQKLFGDTGIQATDIWEQDDTRRLLWNAQIHPVMMVEEDGSLDWEPFFWIQHYLAEGKNGLTNPNAKSSLNLWKNLKKLSLAQIQGMADASAEFSYRSYLKGSQGIQQSVESYKAILDCKLHEEIKLDYIMNSAYASTRSNRYVVYALYLKPIFNMLADIITSKLKDGIYDICSRCYFIMSISCVEFSKQIESQRSTRLDSIDIHVTPCLDSMKSPSIIPVGCCKNMLDYILRMIKKAVETSDSTLLEDCAIQLEHAAFALISKCVSSSIPKPEIDQQFLPPFGKWCITNCPARIDLSGGWSDTPPISWEYGGAVANLAVMMRRNASHVKPLSARCRRVQGLDGIIITVENRNMDNGDLLGSESIHLTRVNEICDFRNPQAKCALSKCALVALGFIPLSSVKDTNNRNIDELIQTWFGEGNEDAFGLELISTSLLPQGSGLGTSSILAGCILSSLGQCLGLEKVRDLKYLTQTILNLEQLLSTGGGWQDQVGGLYPGLKLCTADVNVVPIQVNVETHDITDENIVRLNERLLLAFSGKPRLAKNILQKVLRQWAKRSPEVVSTVKSLVYGAKKCINTIHQNDFKSLGDSINSYWVQKQAMAGKDSGVEPHEVGEIIRKLNEKQMIDGASLTGAGGGGFLALLLREGRISEEVINAAGNETIVWHECRVCAEGLKSFFVEDDASTFRLQWHFKETERNVQ